MTNLTRQTDLPDARQSQVRKCKVFLEELLVKFVGLGCWASAPGWLVAVGRQGTPEVRRQHPESPLQSRSLPQILRPRHSHIILMITEQGLTSLEDPSRDWTFPENPEMDSRGAPGHSPV